MEDLKIFLPISIGIISIIILLIIRSISFKFLHLWASRTETKIDDIIIKSIKTPSIYWCIAIGIYIAISLAEIPVKYSSLTSKIINVIIIFSITIAVANLAGKIYKNYIIESNLPLPTTGLFYGILKGTIIVIGFVMILSFLGISITPIITALGVGGLAVALALQDTLANLFAGIHILVERSIRVGDFIRLETGQEGYVEDITWRTTRIRMLPNNMVVIPNSKLAQSVVTNYYLPEKRMACFIPVSVSYSSDPEKVERVLLEEAMKATKEISGVLEDPLPTVRLFPGFGPSSLDFTVVIHVKEFTDQFPVIHEMRKRIFKRFKEEKIEIPLPEQRLYLKKES
ncbi:MAG: mechanosensitive ion channel family protein [Proteobacteria bacterium]|nr:mechanosensitive ion channel family protein [Pseudomonadota bacterium]